MTYVKTYYGIYFTGSGGMVRLPINPEKLPVSRDNDNAEYNVLGIGPIMVPRTPKLKELSFSGLFPAEDNPDTYINFFESAMLNKSVLVYTPVRYYEDGRPFGLSDSGMQCLVTEFKSEERGGETGDFYFDLTVTEYRDYTPQRMQIATSSASGASNVATAALNATPAAQTQTTAKTLKLMASPSRDIPQGQLYSGAYAICNGTVYQDSQRGYVLDQLNGQRVIVRRIDNEAPSGIYITHEDGTYIGWVEAQTLQVVSET